MRDQKRKKEWTKEERIKLALEKKESWKRWREKELLEDDEEEGEVKGQPVEDLEDAGGGASDRHEDEKKDEGEKMKSKENPEGEEEGPPDEIGECMGEQKFCLDCVMMPCICHAVKLEVKIREIRRSMGEDEGDDKKDRKKKRRPLSPPAVGTPRKRMKKNPREEQEDNLTYTKGKINLRITDTSRQDPTTTNGLETEDREEERRRILGRKGQYITRPHHQPTRSQDSGGAEEVPQQHLVLGPDDGGETGTRSDPPVCNTEEVPQQHQVSGPDDGGETNKKPNPSVNWNISPTTNQ